MIQLSRSYLVAMLLVLLLGFALGAFKLNADNLWLDELYSISNMGVFDGGYSLPEIVDSLNAHSPNHVPLYFVLGRQWARLVGWSQLPMRYLSLLFGILFIAWAYRFAADAFNRGTATLAALLLTTSGFVLLYFHEIRMYTLLLLLMVVHLWLYWRLCDRASARRREWLLFIVTGSALLYTHVFALFFFLGLGLQHLIFAPRIKRWLGILLAWGISALAFLPYLPGFLEAALAERTIASLQETALHAPEIARELAHIVVNGVELLWLPIVALAGLALWQRREPMIMRCLVIWAGIILSLALFNEFFPLIDRLRFRFFLASMPFFTILCAHFLLAPGRLRAISLPFLLLWIAGGLHIYGLGDSWVYAGRNTLFADVPALHKYADALQFKANPLDLVVGYSRSKFVDWPLRHGRSIADYYFGAILNLDHAFVVEQDDEAETRRLLLEQIDDHPYLLLAYDPAVTPLFAAQAAAAIEAEYASCEILVDREDLVVRRFVYQTLACERRYQPIHYDNGIKIVDRFGDYDRERGSLRMVTGWQIAHEAQLDEYNVSIQILKADGQKAGQAGDRHLHDDVLKWHAVEIATADLPPGDYRGVVILYDRASGAKVSGSDRATGETATIHPAVEFRVEQ